MKLAAVALSGSLLPLLASALPPSASSFKTKRQQDSAPSQFRVIADNPDAPEIDGNFMEARGYGFWLGGEPATHCPDNVGDACPAGADTVIRGLSALDTMVPGGQSMFVNTTGAVGYTIAHSSAIPDGALTEGFEYLPGADHGSYGFSGWDAQGYMACPDTAERENFQVFVDIGNASVPTGNRDDCVTFDARVMNLPVAAWQYT